MSNTEISADEITKVFKEHCRKKNYQAMESKEPNNIRLDVSNYRDKSVVKIYPSTLTIQVQGPKNSLRSELDILRQEFEASPQSFLGKEIEKEKACATRYDIILPEVQNKVKESWRTIEAAIEIEDNLNKRIQYIAKISRGKLTLTVTQFSNGTLLLQGKNNTLFSNACEIIERIANPDEKAVIARFISDDEENLKQFSMKYTPELLAQAEANIKSKLGEVYDYLYEYDRKYFVASECLCIAGIPLPEYSALVMPASKGFEGFAKKLTVDIGLFDSNHFKSKNASFGVLSDKTHPKRKAVCQKNKYNETHLEQLDLAIDKYRHFMMHSDDTAITKVETKEEAVAKVNEICREAKEIFNYLKDSINP